MLMGLKKGLRLARAQPKRPLTTGSLAMANRQRFAKNAESTKLKNTVQAVDKTLFRCNTSDACTEKVLLGTHVYIHGEPVINDLILNDLKRNQRCRLSIAKEPFAKGFLSWALAKRSPFYGPINIGILELDAFGLSNYWRDKFSKRATKCLNGNHRNSGNSKETRLSWPTISTTFILLGAGCVLALFIFSSELLIHRIIVWQKNR